jgi:hypothetical protein
MESIPIYFFWISFLYCSVASVCAENERAISQYNFRRYVNSIENQSSFSFDVSVSICSPFGVISWQIMEV